MKTLLLSTLLLAGSFVLNAQNTAPDTLKYCVVDKNTGVGGYDPVSYHEAKAPLKGLPNIRHVHEGVQYLFASEASRKKFVAAPDKFLPEFGGWCSMTLAMGRATTPTYDNYAIIKGKLYLFERTLSVNGRELWLKDPDANKKVATKNYQSYISSGQIK
jgi:YHS domain-containing protein